MRELGNPKGKKPKEVPQHYEVCEPCKASLDAGDEIPLHLLCKLLKYKFLSIKANDLKRRDNEKKVRSELLLKKRRLLTFGCTFLIT